MHRSTRHRMCPRTEAPPIHFRVCHLKLGNKHADTYCLDGHRDESKQEHESGARPLFPKREHPQTSEPCYTRGQGRTNMVCCMDVPAQAMYCEYSRPYERNSLTVHLM